MGPGCCSLQGCSCAIVSNTTTGASPSPRGPPGQAVPTTRVTPPATPRNCAPLAQGCTPTPMYPKCPGVAALSQSGPGDLLLSQAGTPPKTILPTPAAPQGRQKPGFSSLARRGTGIPGCSAQAPGARILGHHCQTGSDRHQRDAHPSSPLWQEAGPQKRAGDHTGTAGTACGNTRPRRGDVTDSNSWLRFRNVSSDLSTGLPPDETPRSHTSLLATA